MMSGFEIKGLPYSWEEEQRQLDLTAERGFYTVQSIASRASRNYRYKPISLFTKGPWILCRIASLAREDRASSISLQSYKRTVVLSG